MEKPDITINAKEMFGISFDMEVPAFSSRSQYSPDIDSNYHFNEEVTLSILAGFKHNRRVMIQGYHGTGKSTHIEQIAARLNWPCIRINLDGNVSRIDLVGKDSIILKEGKQVTEFADGIIPWSLKLPMAIVFDEYDSARPDVMFVIQRLLESEGKFTLMDKNTVLTPNPYFRIFATANTIGLGDSSGLYHGVQPINQGQMDRWNILVTLNYLSNEEEVKIISAKAKMIPIELIKQMVQMASLSREVFKAGDISTVMSPRTVISWAENYIIFNNLALAFKLTFLNKCDEMEREIVAEYYQRCFGVELLASSEEVM